MVDAARPCWCGADSLEEFGGGFARCTACQTLVNQVGLKDSELQVTNDETDYYGKRYWLEHMTDELGYPDIHQRARQDLPERCVHWLKLLLRYRTPPASVLEAGAGDGAYTALLQWVGYEATALDLSPWAAEFARNRFGIRYLVGPIEDTNPADGRFDVVVANDVLEHLTDPVAAVCRCADLLTRDGVMIIQTPEFQVDQTYEELLDTDDPFLAHMNGKHLEHLYLFSRDALLQLLERCGLGKVSFEKSFFEYDLTCVASASPIMPSDSDPIGNLLSRSAQGPFVVALIDAHDAWRVSEEDRQARLDVIERLDAALRVSEADRSARLEVIEKLDRALRESEEERRAQLETIERLKSSGERGDEASR